jgi:lysophospholipase L1-like esterase
MIGIPKYMTWSTSYLAALAGPDETPVFMPQPRGFAGQTVRQAVRLRRGGTSVRLGLSNEFGDEPLLLEGVAVSGVPVPHQGEMQWEIPPGATALSDPVAMSVQAGDELVVDCFVYGTAGPSAFLPAVQRTGEVAPGNQVGNWAAGRRPDGAESFTSGYWITRVLTDAPSAGPVIVALGDSITRGDGSTADRDQRYPDHLQRRLSADGGLAGAVVLNAGISGNRVLQAGFGPSMVDRFARDVLGVPEATHVIIMGGLNDLGGPAVFGGTRPTAEELTAGLLSLASRAAALGIQPVLGTITPLLTSSYESFRADGNEEIRQAVNQALRGQRDWPVADFAASVADQGHPGGLAAAFDSGDGIHLNDDGARALAGAPDLAVFA